MTSKILRPKNPLRLVHFAVALTLLGVFGGSCGGGSSTRPEITEVTLKEIERGYPPERYEVVGPRQGFGPKRPTFSCDRPSTCEGPPHVALNSYFDAPGYGDERRFLKVRLLDGRIDRWHKGLHISNSTTLLMRAYIDNNADRNLVGKKDTDARDTRLRVALPKHPTSAATPTVYIRGENTKPHMVWDSVRFSSSRPMRFTYLPGTTQITQRTNGHVAAQPGPEGIDMREGIPLGNWRRGLKNRAFVTFRLAVTFPSDISRSTNRG